VVVAYKLFRGSVMSLSYLQGISEGPELFRGFFFVIMKNESFVKLRRKNEE